MRSLQRATSLLRLLLVCCSSFSVAAIAHELNAKIEVSLSERTCHPGDIVQLEAIRSEADFATFTLKVPEIKNFRLIQKNSYPLVYKQGKYTQKEIWIFQAVAPATVHFDGAVVEILEGDSVQRQLITPLTLQINPYEVPSIVEVNPEPLPPSLESAESPPRVIFIISAIAIALLVALWVGRKKGSRRSSSHSKDNFDTLDLDSVLLALKKGELPSRSLESLLHQNETTLSPETRQAIEQAVYGNGVSNQSLKDLIEKEARR